MMKKIGLVVGFLIVLGSSAVAAHAQTAVDPSSVADPRIGVLDPFCPADSYCATIESGSAETVAYCDPLILVLDPSGCPVPSGDSSPFILAVPTPPGSYSVPPLYTCYSDVFLESLPTGTLFPLTFTGCNFADGMIPANTPITISATGGPVVLDLPPGFTCSEGCSGDQIDLTPELGTGFLFLTGLLLLSLGAFARKRFGANSLS
jgi:hypothetical protein